MPTRLHDTNPRKNERIGLRASEWQRTLLTAASQAEGTTISDFVLRHATQAAEQVLADRRVFAVTADVWERFATALDQPAKSIPGLETLLNSPTVLDAE